MKNNLIITCVLTFLTLGLFSQVNQKPAKGLNDPQAKHLLTKTMLPGEFILYEDLEQHWGGTQWDDVYKTSYLYDPNHMEEGSVTQEWNGAVWVNYAKFHYSYDAASNLSEQLYQMWIGNQWVDNEQWNYTYNVNNLLTGSIQQVTNGTSLQNAMKTLYVYNGTNNLETEHVQIWTGSWQDSVLTNHTYANNLETFWFRQLWDGSSWINDQRATNTYYANNLLAQTFYELWMNNTFWSNMGLRNITYDVNGNDVLETWQYWDSGLGWVNQSKQAYTYTGSNKISGQLYYFWINSVWENYSRTTYTYDANENLTEYLWELWENSAYVNDMRDLLYYTDITSVDENPGHTGNMVVSENFPNPFRTSTTIKYKIDSRQPVVLTILDASGRTVKTLVNQVQEAGTHLATFSIEDDNLQNVCLTKTGSYLYRLKVGSVTCSRKMIFIK